MKLLRLALGTAGLAMAVSLVSCNKTNIKGTEGSTKALEKNSKKKTSSKKKGKASDDNEPVQALTDDQVTTIVESDAQNARKTVIYASFAHMIKDGETVASDLDVYRYGLTKALNSISVRPTIVIPEAVDDAALVMRVDLESYGIHDRDWAKIQSAPLASDNISQVGNATVVKGDWLVYAVTRPEAYNQIMRIPATIPMLEAQLGVDPSKAVFVGVKTSEVTFSQRVLERIPITTPGKSDGYYWRSYDFARPDGVAKGFSNPESLRTAGIPELVAGEFFFSLPNGLQGYALSGFGQQQRLDAQAFVATDGNRAQDGLKRCVGGVAHCGYVINGESCITCHASGVKLAPSITMTKGATREEIDGLFAADIERFQTALDDMGYPEVNAEPVRETVNFFKQDRNFADKRDQGGEVEAVGGSIATGRIYGR